MLLSEAFCGWRSKTEHGGLARWFYFFFPKHESKDVKMRQEWAPASCIDVIFRYQEATENRMSWLLPTCDVLCFGLRVKNAQRPRCRFFIFPSTHRNVYAYDDLYKNVKHMEISPHLHAKNSWRRSHHQHNDVMQAVIWLPSFFTNFIVNYCQWGRLRIFTRHFLIFDRNIHYEPVGVQCITMNKSHWS